MIPDPQALQHRQATPRRRRKAPSPRAIRVGFGRLSVNPAIAPPTRSEAADVRTGRWFEGGSGAVASSQQRQYKPIKGGLWLVGGPIIRVVPSRDPFK